MWGSGAHAEDTAGVTPTFEPACLEHDPDYVTDRPCTSFASATSWGCVAASRLYHALQQMRAGAVVEHDLFQC